MELEKGMSTYNDQSAQPGHDEAGHWEETRKGRQPPRYTYPEAAAGNSLQDQEFLQQRTFLHHHPVLHLGLTCPVTAARDDYGLALLQ